jgi:hypothetical protein
MEGYLCLGDVFGEGADNHDYAFRLRSFVEYVQDMGHITGAFGEVPDYIIRATATPFCMPFVTPYTVWYVPLRWSDPAYAYLSNNDSLIHCFSKTDTYQQYRTVRGHGHKNGMIVELRVFEM